MKELLENLQNLRIRLQRTDLKPAAKLPGEEATLPTVELVVAAGCNAHCRHCSLWRVPQDLLPVEHAQRFLMDAGSLIKQGSLVQLVGGEPTLHPQLAQIISLARRYDYEVGLTTNAILLEKAEFLELLVSAGLGRLAVSLDGPLEIHDQLRGKGTFAKVLTALQHAKAYPGLKVSIQTVLYAGNIAAMPGFVDWLERESLAEAISFQALVQDFAQQPSSGWYRQNPLWPQDLSGLGSVLDQMAARTSRDQRFHVANPPEQFAFWKRYFADPEQFAIDLPCTIDKLNLGCDPKGAWFLCPDLGPLGHVIEGGICKLGDQNSFPAQRAAIRACRKVCNYTLNCRYELLRNV